ncbi:MAG: collagen-like protein, partial [Bacteroidetes bacterium]|nr:collagen-like protein [Bacteroidota bacterium]
AVLISFSSCSKEGPQGPQGAQGPPGPTGAAGPQGPQGTANVIYSGWLDVTFAADTIHDGNKIDTLGFYATIDAPKLTSEILTSGEMKVYINLGTAADPYISPLPYFSPYNGITIEPNFAIGAIDIYSNLNVSTRTQNGSKTWQYRYILVPGGTAARKASTVDWNDYNAVKKYLNLTD